MRGPCGEEVEKPLRVGARPPEGYRCPYRDACPHLEGVSTSWANECYREDAETLWKLDARVEELEKELRGSREAYGKLERAYEELRAKHRALHQRQFKAGKSRAGEEGKAAQGAGSKEPGKPDGRSAGERKHAGQTRQRPDRVDRTVEVPAPERCPGCGKEGLEEGGEVSEHLQEDVEIEARTVVTCFRHGMAWCSRCGKWVHGRGEGEVRQGCVLGPTARSLVVFLRERMHLPYRKVKGLMREWLGLDVSAAGLWGMCRSAAREGSVLYEDLRSKVQASAQVHADETGWRVNGRNEWLWYAGNGDLAFFEVGERRDGEMAKRVLGEGFGGLLTTDDYAAYNAVGARERQRCLAHPLREARDQKAFQMGLEEKLRDSKAIGFYEAVMKVLGEACEIEARTRRGEEAGDQKSRQRAKRRLIEELGRVCGKKQGQEDAERLRQRLMDRPEDLFRFLDYERADPTNNHAERALRPAVVMRKISGGSRSEAGAWAHGILMSLTETARLKGVDPARFFHTLLTRPAAEAQSVLYGVG